MTNKATSSGSVDELVLWLTYFLYLLFAPALIGFGINFIASKFQKKIPDSVPLEKDARAMILSHHRWLMRTFIFVSVFVMAGLGTMYYGVGYFVASAALIWWFYRVIKGMVAFAGHRSMPA